MSFSPGPSVCLSIAPKALTKRSPAPFAFSMNRLVPKIPFPKPCHSVSSTTSEVEAMYPLDWTTNPCPGLTSSRSTSPRGGAARPILLGRSAKKSFTKKDSPPSMETFTFWNRPPLLVLVFTETPSDMYTMAPASAVICSPAPSLTSRIEKEGRYFISYSNTGQGGRGRDKRFVSSRQTMRRGSFAGGRGTSLQNHFLLVLTISHSAEQLFPNHFLEVLVVDHASEV